MKSAKVKSAIVYRREIVPRSAERICCAHIALEMIERQVSILANAPADLQKSTKDRQLAKTALNQTFDCESPKKLLLKPLCFFFRFDSLLFAFSK